MSDSTEYNFLTIWHIPYFWFIRIHTSRHTYIFSYYFLPYSFKNQTTQFIIFIGEWSLFDSTKTVRPISHFLMVFVLLQVKVVIIFSRCLLHLDISYFTCSTCCNHSQFWNHKIYIETKVIETWSSPRYPHCSNFLVCIKNHLFIVGIGPIRDKEL